MEPYRGDETWSSFRTLLGRNAERGFPRDMDLAVTAQELIQQHGPAMEVGSALDKTQRPKGHVLQPTAPTAVERWMAMQLTGLHLGCASFSGMNRT